METRMEARIEPQLLQYMTRERRSRNFQTAYRNTRLKPSFEKRGHYDR